MVARDWGRSCGEKGQTGLASAFPEEFPLGMLVCGVWTNDVQTSRNPSGEFLRPVTTFRHRILPDNAARFSAERGRYHLYVSRACPWSHRALIMHSLKHLDTIISVSTVAPILHDQGWEFKGGHDPVSGCRFLHEVYTLADVGYTGRVTVPVLWDRKHRTIVNNESADIMRILDHDFKVIGEAETDYAPINLVPSIEGMIEFNYRNVNNAVYRAGFAKTQEAYDAATASLFRTLDELEERLGHERFLLGDRQTEADWCLFPTLIRFDPVYYVHFKCNMRHLYEYQNLWAYTRDLFQTPGIAETVDFAEIKEHYYRSQRGLNRYGIVPIGPEPDFQAPHRRNELL